MTLLQGVWSIQVGWFPAGTPQHHSRLCNCHYRVCNDHHIHGSDLEHCNGDYLSSYSGFVGKFCWSVFGFTVHRKDWKNQSIYTNINIKVVYEPQWLHDPEKLCFNSQGEEIGVHPWYLMLPAAISCSFAFMLPVATPPNAIVFSGGHLKVKDMVCMFCFKRLGLFEKKNGRRKIPNCAWKFTKCILPYTIRNLCTFQHMTQNHW